MRGAFLFGALLVGCAAAAAQPGRECARDTDCVASVACCPECCECPRAVTRAVRHQQEQRCARIDCDLPDCTGIHCDACPPLRPACIDGACTSR